MLIKSESPDEKGKILFAENPQTGMIANWLLKTKFQIYNIMD